MGWIPSVTAPWGLCKEFGIYVKVAHFCLCQKLPLCPQSPQPRTCNRCSINVGSPHHETERVPASIGLKDKVSPEQTWPGRGAGRLPQSLPASTLTLGCLGPLISCPEQLSSQLLPFTPLGRRGCRGTTRLGESRRAALQDTAGEGGLGMQGAAGAGMGIHWMRTVCRGIEDDAWASRVALSRGHSERSRGLSSVGCEGPAGHGRADIQ